MTRSVYWDCQAYVFLVKVEPSCPLMRCNQEIPSVLIDLPVSKQTAYKTVYLNCKPRGGVRIKFSAVGVIIELSLSFNDVIFFAENNKCRPFVCRFNNHVLTLSKFAKGNLFIGR